MLLRVVRFWVYGTGPAAVLLLLLTPTLSSNWPTWRLAVWLMLPLYMLHQFEEHDDDRFRRFVNAEVGQGREILSSTAIFLINVPGVWGLAALSFMASGATRPGFGLIAIYLVLTNAVVHLGAAASQRRYNPGLWTAAFGFVPLGTWALIDVIRTHPPTTYQAIALVVSVSIHVAIAKPMWHREIAPNVKMR